MRYILGFICVIALGMMGCSETAGTGGSGGDGGAAGSAGGGGQGGVSDFVAGPPVTVSGPSPIADCDQPVREGWSDAEKEPWIAVNPTNSDNIVGIWMQDIPPRRALVAAVSFDGGASWASVVIPGLTLCSGGEWPAAADPWLAFAANGDLYASSLVFGDRVGQPTPSDGVLVSKSTDGGRTWGPPTTVSLVEGVGSDDKESITADPVDECSVYVTWSRFDGQGQAGGGLMFSKTADCGQTWSEPQTVFLATPVGLGAQLVALADGTLLIFSKEQDNLSGAHPIYLSRSTDGGDTWTAEPEVIADVLAGPPVTPDGGELVRTGFFDVAVHTETGRVALVWEQFLDGAPPMNVAFASSSDAGRTWSEPIRIDQAPPGESFTLEQAFLPSVEFSDDGTLGVTYYSFQNDTLGDSRADADHWFIHCHPELADCNATDGWSDGIRLTSESFDYLEANLATSPVFPGLFLGDYVGLAAAGSDFFAFFPVTTDDDPANTIFVPIRRR